MMSASLNLNTVVKVQEEVLVTQQIVSYVIGNLVTQNPKNITHK